MINVTKVIDKSGKSPVKIGKVNIFFHCNFPDRLVNIKIASKITIIYGVKSHAISKNASPTRKYSPK